MIKKLRKEIYDLEYERLSRLHVDIPVFKAFCLLAFIFVLWIIF
jgi:hypothetical protein